MKINDTLIEVKRACKTGAPTYSYALAEILADEVIRLRGELRKLTRAGEQVHSDQPGFRAALDAAKEILTCSS